MDAQRQLHPFRATAGYLLLRVVGFYDRGKYFSGSNSVHFIKKQLLARFLPQFLYTSICKATVDAFGFLVTLNNCGIIPDRKN